MGGIIQDQDKISKNLINCNLPETVSVMANIGYDSNNEELIYIKSVGGSSALNLIGRFLHIHPKLFELGEEISLFEKSKIEKKDVILAEVVHLPDPKLGNVICRPNLRKYEINYLAPKNLDSYSINPSDLKISIRDNQVILESISLNKQIIPRLR